MGTTRAAGGRAEADHRLFPLGAVMRVLLSAALMLFVACATQPAPAPAPEPDWRTLEQCDPTLVKVSALDMARGKTQGDVTPPKIIKRVNPVVPTFRGTHFVETQSIIDETGRVTSICRVSGDPQLVESVVQAMRQ